MIINMNGAKAPETPSPVLQEKTVTPETLPTVIGADEGYDGLSQVTVNPDPQLKPENIRSGKSIFGVSGSFVGDAVMGPVDLYQVFSQSTKSEEYAFNFPEFTNVYDLEGNQVYTGNYFDASTEVRGYDILIDEADQWFYEDQIYSISNTELLTSETSKGSSLNIPMTTTAHIEKGFFGALNGKTHLRGKLCYMLFPLEVTGQFFTRNYCFSSDAIKTMDLDVDLGEFPYILAVDVEFPPTLIGSNDNANRPLKCLSWFEYVVVN